MSKRLDVFLIFVVSLLWAANYFVVKGVLAFVDPITFAFLRAFLGGLFVLSIGHAFFKGIRRSDLAWLSIIGLFNVAIFLVLLNVGLTTISPGVAATLVYTQPVFVVAFSPLIGEALTFRKVSGVVAAFTGVGVIFISSLTGFKLVTGDLLLLGAGLSWAFSILVFKRWRTGLNSYAVSAVQLLLGSLFILPVLSFQKIALNPTFDFWAYLLYNIVLATGLGYLLYFRILSRMTASEFSSYLFLVPTLATALGSILQLALPTWNEAIGTILVALGIYAANR